MLSVPRVAIIIDIRRRRREYLKSCFVLYIQRSSVVMIAPCLVCRCTLYYEKSFYRRVYWSVKYSLLSLIHSKSWPVPIPVPFLSHALKMIREAGDEAIVPRPTYGFGELGLVANEIRAKVV